MFLATNQQMMMLRISLSYTSQSSQHRADTPGRLHFGVQARQRLVGIWGGGDQILLHEALFSV